MKEERKQGGREQRELEREEYTEGEGKWLTPS